AVTFARQGDRFGHTIALVDSGGEQPLLESIEGSPDDLWPASPALQELHVENRGSVGPVALLVGMAGRSQWSASIPIDLAMNRVVFDLACRVRDVPQHVGCSYRLLDAARITGADVESLCIAGRVNSLRMELLPVETNKSATASQRMIVNPEKREFAIR